MRKNIFILMLVGLFLTGCGDAKEKIQEKDYSKYSFSNVRWKKKKENDIDKFFFKLKSKDGKILSAIFTFKLHLSL